MKNEAIHALFKNYSETKKCSPMTLEGCVVRISDIIGYIGRDIEDAIQLGENGFSAGFVWYNENLEITKIVYYGLLEIWE